MMKLDEAGIKFLSRCCFFFRNLQTGQDILYIMKKWSIVLFYMQLDNAKNNVNYDGSCMIH